MDPYTPNPYGTLMDPFKGTLVAPLKEPYMFFVIFGCDDHE